ncbi:type II toxin-antitoxin system RelE/ParE family toxin [Oribacterium sp. FC2011]|uniref:type II toxin-antitoxin system RelE/ParE family toxin n=1 Tax=Oribacterium sp. FC2011 TaxID=1408311 RepID=UPI002E8DFD31|nr:type II toxin-antitoxin system RelE/ParE family toxin [Oribacterium sp. FC2011]
MTESAEADLDGFIWYLLNKKKSVQAASNLIDDFEATKDSLSLVAGSLKFCDNPRLKKLGYRRLNFLSHRYFLLYRLDGEKAIIDNIFHELQDYESRIQ